MPENPKPKRPYIIDVKSLRRRAKPLATLGDAVGGIELPTRPVTIEERQDAPTRPEVVRLASAGRTVARIRLEDEVRDEFAEARGRYR